MQHPSLNSTSRTPEMLRRAQAILAVTAAAYGLTREKDRPRPPGPQSGASSRPGGSLRARTREHMPERALETSH
jgi:hypothetical protein